MSGDGIERCADGRRGHVVLKSLNASLPNLQAGSACGRRRSCTAVLQDMRYSAQHFVFDDEWNIVDLSVNGVFVNGKKLGRDNRHRAQEGDVVTLCAKSVAKAMSVFGEAKFAAWRAERAASSEALDHARSEPQPEAPAVASPPGDAEEASAATAPHRFPPRTRNLARKPSSPARVGRSPRKQGVAMFRPQCAPRSPGAHKRKAGGGTGLGDDDFAFTAGPEKRVAALAGRSPGVKPPAKQASPAETSSILSHIFGELRQRTSDGASAPS